MSMNSIERLTDLLCLKCGGHGGFGGTLRDPDVDICPDCQGTGKRHPELWTRCPECGGGEWRCFQVSGPCHGTGWVLDVTETKVKALLRKAGALKIVFVYAGGRVLCTAYSREYNASKTTNYVVIGQGSGDDDLEALSAGILAAEGAE